jgi:aspartate/tyrosine/aromatic aminotransferase
MVNSPLPMSFSSLPPSKPDPIFTIAARAKAAGPTAINGTIGVYLDEEGKALLLPSVRRAIEDVAKTLPDRTYGYPELLGLPEYRSGIETLLFPKKKPVTASLATTGGTGALAMSLRLAVLAKPGLRVLLPAPPYVNHTPLCRSAGLEILEVPYFSDGHPSIEGIVDGLKQNDGPLLLLIQAGCNNPTGLDLTPEQWRELAPILTKHDCTALLDLPYQGFSGTPEEDAEPVGIVAETGVTTLVAWSGAKNHSLYSERAGLACAVVPDAETKVLVEAHFSMITRGIHSPSATIGQRIVARVQEAYGDEWRKDLSGMRATLNRKREVLAAALPEHLRACVMGKGMFAQLPVTPEQSEQLEAAGVYLVRGRINIAGIPLSRMEELGRKLSAVL